MLCSINRKCIEKIIIKTKLNEKINKIIKSIKFTKYFIIFEGIKI